MSRRGIPNLKHRSASESIFLNSMPEPNSGCWLWLGNVNKWGYGRLTRKQMERQAHRLSYTALVGEIPDGTCVLHRCDMPCCVNPDHLFLGSLSDNMQDCLAKSRHVARRGNQNPNSKLTAEAVAKIHSSSLTISDLARQFGISRRAIRFVKMGVTWSK